MSGNMHLYMYVSDTVQQISIYWIVSSKLSEWIIHNELKRTCVDPSDIHLSDTVQQIKHPCLGWCPSHLT